MNKFRKLWMIVVAAVVILFFIYKISELRKNDSSGPVFSCEQKTLEVSIYDEEEVFLEGVTASDRKDGDVTDSILIEKLSNLYEGNKRTATYVAFDSDNHVAEMERELIYKDYTSPRFQLTGSLRFRAGENVNIDKIVKASDCIDGDISNKVKIHTDTAINNRVIGIYTIEYEVTNSAGDHVKLPIDIEIYEAKSNEVELNLSTYLLYYDGEEINYKDYLKSVKFSSLERPFEGVDLLEPADTDSEDEEDQETENVQSSNTIPKSRVTVRSEVEKNNPGIYPIYFYYRDDRGMITYEATEVMYVVVE